MELKWNEREAAVWLGSRPVTKSVRVTAESVIPDTGEDLAQLFWTQGSLLLKEKELSAHGVTVSGEARATVLYRTEGEGKLAWLRLQKPFSLDFEAQAVDEEALPQVQLALTAVEGRALNPRKLAVSFDITAELQSFRAGSIPIQAELPEGAPAGLHLLREEREAYAIAAVCEKPFTLREQFSPQMGQPVPEEIAGESIRFTGLTAEQIGQRSVGKGEMALQIWGLNGEGAPVRLDFSAPFSQLLDTGEVQPEQFQLSALPSSVYLDWVESPGGGRALDAEIHGVLQLVLWTKQPVSLIRDAYSTREACTPTLETRRLLTDREQGSLSLSVEETLPLPEDCADLIDARFAHGMAEFDREGGVQPLSLDLLVRSAEEGLRLVHRELQLKGPAMPELARRTCETPETPVLRVEGDKLRVTARTEVLWTREREEELSCVTALTLEPEEERSESSPSVYLVRRDGMSLWELGKRYRASPEAIGEMNGEDAKFLLIPAEG